MTAIHSDVSVRTLPGSKPHPLAAKPRSIDFSSLLGDTASTNESFALSMPGKSPAAAAVLAPDSGSVAPSTSSAAASWSYAQNSPVDAPQKVLSGLLA